MICKTQTFIDIESGRLESRCEFVDEWKTAQATRLLGKACCTGRKKEERSGTAGGWRNIYISSEPLVDSGGLGVLPKNIRMSLSKQ